MMLSSLVSLIVTFLWIIISRACNKQVFCNVGAFSMTTGFLVLSPNEVDQVLRKQYEDNRIRRLLEVRNLAKHHARVKREQFQNVKNQKNQKEIKTLKVSSFLRYLIFR